MKYVSDSEVINVGKEVIKRPKYFQGIPYPHSLTINHIDLSINNPYMIYININNIEIRPTFSSPLERQELSRRYSESRSNLENSVEFWIAMSVFNFVY